MRAFEFLIELKTKIRPGQTKKELYKDWELTYQTRPSLDSKEYRGYADNFRYKNTKPIRGIIGNSAEDVVQKLKDAIDSLKGVELPSTGNVTIFFNAALAREVIGHGDEIYATIISNGSNPVLLLSSEKQSGMYRAIDRSPKHQRGQEGFVGQQAFAMPAAEAKANGLTLARYGLGNLEQEYMPGITAIALEFKGDVLPGEIVRLKGPGLTVSPPVKGGNPLGNVKGDQL